MRYAIVDLEATCWQTDKRPERMEIIEIGAVMLESGAIMKEFAEFVRPVNEPILSGFCLQLTSIRQQDVNTADEFPYVLRRFLGWIGGDPYTLCSWGMYDLKQLEIDCRRHDVPFPKRLNNHINLKQEFATLMGIKRCGMATALEILGIPLEGKHHRGIDDARNIAKIAQLILPRIGLTSA